jgi:hypothetical protein
MKRAFAEFERGMLLERAKIGPLSIVIGNYPVA